MEYASTHGVVRHRQNKAFKQRLAYWLKKDLPYEEALRRAELRNQMNEPLKLVSVSLDGTENLPGRKPTRTKTCQDENQWQGQRSQHIVKSLNTSPRIRAEPSRAEIRREVERLKASGQMTEIRQTDFYSSVVSDHENSPVTESQYSSMGLAEDKGYDLQKLTFWLIALLCSSWLTHSMAQMFGGTLWDYIIAGAFDFSPVLLAGTKVESKKTEQMALVGGIGIFVAGLTLYLAPHIQTVFNEFLTQSKLASHYVEDLRQYETKSANSMALINAAKSEFESASSGYQLAFEKFGEKSWRTLDAKQKKDKALSHWANLSSYTQQTIKPLAPVFSDSLRTAIQEIIKRVGLFGIAFLLMFVMRRLESKEPKKGVQ